MREALSGTSSQRFTVSPASISIFWVVVGWCWLCFCFCFGVLVIRGECMNFNSIEGCQQ